MKLVHRSGTLALDRVAVMGVLNVTPDSFSDGGLWLDADAAVAHGLDMVARGAAIIDIGGESTRPGADPVPEDEELRRVMPVIERLAERVDVPISIDTRKASVARRAVDAGASIVNDTTGETDAAALHQVVAETGAAVVLMHSRGTPATMRSMTNYDDVVADVRSFLRDRAQALVKAGVPPDTIAVDPGIGFAKTPHQNLELLRRLPDLCDLGYPMLVGTSRKSFMGVVLGLTEDQRLEATCASVCWSVAHGAKIVRVHDVEAVVRAVRMTEAIQTPDRAKVGD